MTGFENITVSDTTGDIQVSPTYVPYDINRDYITNSNIKLNDAIKKIDDYLAEKEKLTVTPIIYKPNGDISSLLTNVTSEFKITFNLDQKYYFNGRCIDDIEVIVPKKVVVVTVSREPNMTCGGGTKKYKLVCKKEDGDVFSLETACFIALAKDLYSDFYTFEGVMKKAEEIKYIKGFDKMVRYALTAYRKKCRDNEKKEKEENELKAIIARKRAKNAEKKKKRNLSKKKK